MLAKASIHRAIAHKCGSSGTTVDAGLRQHDDPL
jgi:hypothetical protein